MLKPLVIKTKKEEINTNKLIMDLTYRLEDLEAKAICKHKCELPKVEDKVNLDELKLKIESFIKDSDIRQRSIESRINNYFDMHDSLNDLSRNNEDKLQFILKRIEELDLKLDDSLLSFDKIKKDVIAEIIKVEDQLQVNKKEQSDLRLLINEDFEFKGHLKHELGHLREDVCEKVHYYDEVIKMIKYISKDIDSVKAELKKIQGQ